MAPVIFLSYTAVVYRAKVTHLNYVCFYNFWLLELSKNPLRRRSSILSYEASPEKIRASSVPKMKKIDWSHECWILFGRAIRPADMISPNSQRPQNRARTVQGTPDWVRVHDCSNSPKRPKPVVNRPLKFGDNSWPKCWKINRRKNNNFYLQCQLLVQS